jgi:hypothetical protein
MARAYGKDKTIQKLEAELRYPDTLYKKKCVNWKGTVIDDGSTYYSELIAEYLLARGLDQLEKIKPITRKLSYRTTGHDGIGTSHSNRHEEIFAKRLMNKNIGYLGTILDYQMPLKDVREDEAGKIDLVSCNEQMQCFYLTELKCGKNPESLLRTALEIYTYYRQLNKLKFLQDFERSGLDVRKGILLTTGTRAFSEANDSNRPQLKRLLKKMGVRIFSIDPDHIEECQEIRIH